MLLTANLGCQSDPEPLPTQPTVSTPDYSRPLTPGQQALRKIERRHEWPNIELAFETRDPLLMQALDRSILWFIKPSSRTHFPINGITHQQAQASVIGLKDLLEHSDSPTQFMAEFERLFDVYESVGYNGEGVVLFTGYYAPVLQASKTRTSAFTYPLYMRPDDLVTDERTGEPLGRRTQTGDLVPYYTRREIEEGNLLEGSELVWLPDALSAYIVHVNGSAKLRLRDGSPMYVGYAGKTDRTYSSLGQQLIREGLIPSNEMSLSAIRDLFRDQPQQVRELMYANESYVFFQQYPRGNWPAGSLGFPVTTERTLATDKKIYPRGGMVLVSTDTIGLTGRRTRFHRFMLDQDTGGAIKAPGRADIFMGVGPTAEIIAGGQYAEGRLYYMFIKPQYIELYQPPTEDYRSARMPNSAE